MLHLGTMLRELILNTEQANGSRIESHVWHTIRLSNPLKTLFSQFFKVLNILIVTSKNCLVTEVKNCMYHTRPMLFALHFVPSNRTEDSNLHARNSTLESVTCSGFNISIHNNNQLCSLVAQRTIVSQLKVPQQLSMANLKIKRFD